MPENTTALQKLPKAFGSRDDLIAFVASISPGIEQAEASPIKGGAQEAERKLAAIDPMRYGRTRNFLDGKVTRLSPYIRHGVISLNRVRNEALERAPSPDAIEKFIQELAWRDFWQRVYRAHPDWIWQDIEPYKTGFQPHDYADTLPDDVAR